MTREGNRNATMRGSIVWYCRLFPLGLDIEHTPEFWGQGKGKGFQLISFSLLSQFVHSYWFRESERAHLPRPKGQSKDARETDVTVIS